MCSRVCYASTRTQTRICIHTHERTVAGNGHRKHVRAGRGQRRALAAAQRANCVGVVKKVQKGVLRELGRQRALATSRARACRSKRSSHGSAQQMHKRPRGGYPSAAGTPKMQAPACAPRPARSAIGSRSATASGRGRVGPGRRRAPAARGCAARPQPRAPMPPRGAAAQGHNLPAQPSGALLHRRRPRARAAPPRAGSPLCVIALFAEVGWLDGAPFRGVV